MRWPVSTTGISAPDGVKTPAMARCGVVSIISPTKSCGARTSVAESDWLQLEGKGYRFLTDHSDTEVLVHGFAEWGEELPKHLNGMFAFAAHDRSRGVLFLARDRFGEKPLYYANGPQGFAFASELSSLRLHSTGEVDRAALKKLLAYGFLPAPLTLYRNLRKLPAGLVATSRSAELLAFTATVAA